MKAQLDARAGSVVDDRQRWRKLCLFMALLGLLVLVASALPWFAETKVFESGGSRTKAIYLWTEGPTASSRSRSGTLAQMAGAGQWGLFVVMAAGIGALCALFARGQHPGDPRLGPALRLTAGAAVLAPVFAVLALIGANGGERISALPHVGFVVTVLALFAWLAGAAVMWRAGALAKASGRHTW
ncbi:hypothetical protein EV385_1244 [Krasilnikovia cinnamomea]|uniref:Uncharacterized protein n=1 Tax=Krasilnikovia cinnamomea TaxID=349313 RepID=A0A4Q7ZH19_9ACTN|nr:hypothetical protein [Krasilnikovia cinnamomea]RZU49493.1 hypothetical protein EV385_1244 [Krasilnikovia cinnamomea]